VLTAMLLLVAAFALIVGAVPLAFAWQARQPVRVRRIRERREGLLLSFRNRDYFDQFCHHNLEHIAPYALRHNQKIPGPVEEAIAAFSRRLEGQPAATGDAVQDYLDRGQLYLRAGRYEEALGDLQQALGAITYADPRFLDALFFRSQAHLHLGNTAEARADLENYVGSSGDRAKVQQARRWLRKLRTE